MAWVEIGAKETHQSQSRQAGPAQIEVGRDRCRIMSPAPNYPRDNVYKKPTDCGYGDRWRSANNSTLQPEQFKSSW